MNSHGLHQTHQTRAAEAQRAAPPLAGFVAAFSRLIDTQPDEARVLRDGGALLADLVARDDWLPESFARSDPERYQQFLLHRDPDARFSIVSFVWGPGQVTPIHDHTVWGLIGMLRGAEYSQPYAFDGAGLPVPAGAPLRLAPGQVEAVSPTLGDVHRVGNVYHDRVSISIHVYGADIGAIERSVYREDGTRKPFVSGYTLPAGVA
ncbi:cysteine dioxygenase [Burkholderia glumae]